jgi:hypothetical protein
MHVLVRLEPDAANGWSAEDVVRRWLVAYPPKSACAYIDLNPVAAGLAATPETSPHTSVHQRVEHAAAQGKLEELKAAACGSVAGSLAAGAVEEDLWLCPIENRRREGSLREGLLEGFSLGSYLLLIDYTSRLCRQGKARISRVCGLDPGPLGHQRRGMGPADPAAIGEVAALGQLFQRGSRAIAATRPAARRPSPGQPGRRDRLSPIIESFFPISHATRNRSSRRGFPGRILIFLSIHFPVR